MNSQITFQFLSIKTRWLCFFSWWYKNSSQISFFLHYIGNWKKKIVVTWNLLNFFAYLLVLLMKRNTANNFSCQNIIESHRDFNNNNVQIFSPPKNVSTFLKKNWVTLQRGGRVCCVKKSYFMKFYDLKIFNARKSTSLPKIIISWHNHKKKKKEKNCFMPHLRHLRPS